MGLLAVLGTLLASSFACRRSADRPPALLLITLDTTRPDRLSAYGYPRPTTPALDRLVRDGARFEAAYAPVNFTTAAHATLFTGQDPPEHGVRANVGDGFPLPETALTLADHLRAAGFTTAGFVGAYTAGLESGLGQGFDRFREPNYDRGAERRGDEVVDEALAWLEGLPTTAGPRPWFLWVHLFDPHGPYVPPPEYLDRVLEHEPDAPAPPPGSPEDDLRRYDGELRYADAQLERLLSAVRAHGPVFIALLADHGETLTERPCGFYHGHNIFEEQMRVPWLLSGPGIPAGRRVATPVPTRDVATTLLGALGVKRPAAFHGRDLMPVLRGEGEPAPTPIYLEAGTCDPTRCSDCAPVGVAGKLTGVRSGRFKLVHTPTAGGARLELYDLAQDPGERQNVAASFPHEVKQLEALRAAHFKTLPHSPSALQPQDAARLEALGYTR